MMQSEFLRLYLIRHCEVEGAEEGRVFGHTDVALSKKGLEQSQRVVEWLASVTLSAVFSSDLKRASQLAEMIAGRHRLKVQTDAAWREINMGDWEGRRVVDLHREFPGLVEHLFSDPASFIYPNGESFETFTARVQAAKDDLLLTHPVGNVALVAHGGVCRNIIGHALSIPMTNWLRLAQDYGCMNVLDWYGPTPMLRHLNIEW